MSTILPKSANGKLSDARLAELLEQMARSVFGHRRAVVTRHDLTPPLARALQRLGGDRPRAMSGLAEVLECDASNVTGIVDRLEAKGLVERRVAEDDRRVKTVAVTANGEKVLRRLQADLATLPAQVAALDPAGRDQLASLLSAVLGGK
jgi:DNA-binding MarR family transcriptional regulator